MTQAALILEAPAREGLRDRILTMRSQPMFEAVDDDGLLLLAEHARSATYRPGEVLAREGEPAAAFVIVIEGAVELSWKGRPMSTTSPGSQAHGPATWRSCSRPRACATSRRLRSR